MASLVATAVHEQLGLKLEARKLTKRARRLE
jgi:hypothetical protein